MTPVAPGGQTERAKDDFRTKQAIGNRHTRLTGVSDVMVIFVCVGLLSRVTDTISKSVGQEGERERERGTIGEMQGAVNWKRGGLKNSLPEVPDLTFLGSRCSQVNFHSSSGFPI